MSDCSDDTVSNGGNINEEREQFENYPKAPTENTSSKDIFDISTKYFIKYSPPYDILKCLALTSIINLIFPVIIINYLFLMGFLWFCGNWDAIKPMISKHIDVPERLSNLWNILDTKAKETIVVASKTSFLTFGMMFIVLFHS